MNLFLHTFFFQLPWLTGTKKINWIFFLCLPLLSFAQSEKTTSWTSTQLFDKSFFIENKGQYKPLHPQLNNADIRFYSSSNGLNYYFTKNAIWISHFVKTKRSRQERIQLEKIMKAVKNGEEESEEDEKNEREVLRWKGEEQFYCMEFTGSSANIYIEGQEELTRKFNYTIADAENKTIRAAAYKKIIYRELYPGIDMEVIFPTDREGFKYNLLLHAGANPALVVIRYPLSRFVKSGDDKMIRSSSPFGDFVEHTPVAMQGNRMVDCRFELKNNSSTFQLGEYTASEPLVIDPWVTTPGFSVGKDAYDVDWDDAGNCYVYGGGIIKKNAHEIVKLDKNGTVLWNYVLNEFGKDHYTYGDFAVDRQTQSVYVVSSGMFYFDQKAKLDANGNKTISFLRDSTMSEMWRLAYNSCTHQGVIGGGGTSDLSNHAAVLDTNLANSKSVHVLNSNQGAHDVWGVAQDNSGNCYIAVAKCLYPGFDNVLLKVPFPALSPITWMVPTYYHFYEALSYMGNKHTVGYNGMCISNNALYTYDCYSLKKWDTTNGSMIDSISVDTSSTPMFKYYGGLTADDCGHVLLALGKKVMLKDANSNQLSNVYTAPDTIYDLSLGRDNLLYACGKGFAAAVQLNLPLCNPLTTVKHQVNATCDSLGTASINVSGGVPPYTISWNTIPVQTGGTITNLLPGIYIATIKDASCPKKVKADTVEIIENNNLNVITTVTSIHCKEGKGSVLVNVLNGAWPYTYNWSPVPDTDSLLTDVPEGIYTVTVTDKNGCTKSITAAITISGTVQQVTVTAVNANCNGDASGSVSAVVTGGAAPYTYLWNPGGIATPSANNLKAGLYSLTVTAADGCKVTDSIRISEPPPIQLTTSSKDDVCGNGTGAAAVQAMGGVAPYTCLWNNGTTGNSLTNLKSGSYEVSVMDKNNCTKTATILVKNNNDYGPKAEFTCNPEITDLHAPEIKFFDKSKSAQKWYWNFGDGGIDSVQNPSHLYKESGTYNVTLQIANSYGCVSSVTLTVIIRPLWSFYIPNSFTPDGDGLNDTFNGKGEGLQAYQLIIFNRWGEEIFESNSLTVPWDGKANDGTETAQQDVYIFLVVLKDSKGGEHRYTGTVTLVK